jgi:flagellar protein FliS
MNPTSTQHRAHTAYRDAARTLTPAQQIVLLYDGAIRRLTEAGIAIEAGRIEDRFHAVTKAFDILSALQACLDAERGGEIAPLLHRYYAHALTRMLQINQTNDPAICRELVAYLAPMRDSWAQIAAGRAPGLPPSPVLRPAEAASASLTT